MDLQLERNLEAFLRLIRRPPSEVGENMSFTLGQCRFVLEALPDRLLLTGMVTAVRPNILLRVLQHCIPQNTQGIVQRAFILEGELMINCELPPEEDPLFWYQIVCWQQRILTTYAGRK